MVFGRAVATVVLIVEIFLTEEQQEQMQNGEHTSENG